MFFRNIFLQLLPPYPIPYEIRILPRSRNQGGKIEERNDWSNLQQQLSLPPSLPPLRERPCHPSRSSVIGNQARGITYNDNMNYMPCLSDYCIATVELSDRKTKRRREGRVSGPISRNFLPNDVISRRPRFGFVEFRSRLMASGYLNYTVFNDGGEGNSSLDPGIILDKNRAAGVCAGGGGRVLIRGNRIYSGLLFVSFQIRETGSLKFFCSNTLLPHLKQRF